MLVLPPQHGPCHIWLASGRYASYWNAFLFLIVFFLYLSDLTDLLIVKNSNKFLISGVVIFCLCACGVTGQTFYWSSYASQGLTSVPTNLPFQTSSLSLSNNSINTLRKNDFERLLTCTRLDISHNMISKIEKGAFNGLKFLNVLNLSSNRISSLTEGSFLGIPKLRNLLLESNLLSNPEAGLMSELTNLPILAYMDLSGNNITYLKDNDVFKRNFLGNFRLARKLH